MINRLFFLTVIFIAATYSTGVYANDFFSPLWDFIQWIYDSIESIKNEVLKFAIKIVTIGTLYWIKLKIYTVTLVWSIVKPMIETLNLTDVLIQHADALPQDVKALFGHWKIPECINVVVSARVTRFVLDFLKV